MESEFIGRQPIVNRKQVILGYRLLYEGVPDVQYSEDAADAKPVLPERHLISQFEEALGGAMGFIEVDVDMLESPFVNSLAGKQFVVEIGPLEDQDPTAVAKTCRSLRERGLRICLGNYSRRDNRQALLEYASFIKIDAIATPSAEIKTIMRRMRSHNVEVVASRVDLPAQFDNLVERGIDLFQGYFYARHDPEEEKELSPDRATIIELLTKVSTNVDLGEIEDAFKKNANLGVNLLRLVNELQLARSQPLETVAQALVMIGAHGLARWLNILLFVGDIDDGPTTPLFKLASSRGRLMELLHLEIFGSDPGAEQMAVADRTFLIGMLSLANVVLGVSEEKAIADLGLSDEIRKALESYEGEAGELLKLSKLIEDSDLDGANEILAKLGLSRVQLQNAQLESFAWVNAL